MSERVTKVRLTAQVSEYKAAMESAAKATRELGSEAEKMAQKREAFNTLGAAGLAAGTAMLAGSVLAAKAAMDWESAWAGVTKTVDGTDSQLAKVEQGLRDLTSVLPASHQEIAAVAEAAGQLGVQTDNVVAFTRVMIDLGETTNLSANDAATSLARFTNIMGTSQDQVSNLGSALVGLGNNYATTEREILEMSMRLAGAGRQIGMSEGDVLGLATALSSVGIEAEAGGSAMSKVMIDIAASVEDGGERLQMFARVAGMSGAQFAQQWRAEPSAALAAFVKGLANAESQGSSTLGILAELGITEVRMRDALLRSASAADQFSAAMAMGNEEFKLNNALTEEAAKRYETAESKVKIAGNAIRDAAIDFGSVLLPAVAGGAEAIAAIAKGFGDLPEPVQGLITVFGTAAGVIGVLGGAALLAVPKIIEFRIAMQTLGVTGGTVRGGLAGMARFLGGPLGIALMAATASFIVMNKEIERGLPTQKELIAAIRSTTDATESMAAATERSGLEKNLWGDYADSIEKLPELLDKASAAQWRWGELSFNEQGALDSLSRYGSALAELAQTDFSKAQSSFKGLVDQWGLSKAQAAQLLNEMPALRDLLVEQADAAGLATDEQTILNLAMGKTPGPAGEAAGALEAVGLEAEQAESFLSEMAKALDDIARTSLDMGAALDDAQAALNRMAEAADDEEASLSGANNASISLRDSIREVEEAHRASAEAILNNGGSLEEAMGNWIAGRDAVVQMRMAMGESEEEARAWADTNLGTAAEVEAALGDVATAVAAIPANKDIAINAETGQAKRSIEEIVNMLRTVPTSKTVGFGTVLAPTGNEIGGMWSKGAREFATGGMSFPSGVYAGGQNIHKFAETGLPWETYISPKPGYERQNIGYALESLNRLGFQFPQQQASSGPAIPSQIVVRFGDQDFVAYTQGVIAGSGALIYDTVRGEDQRR